MTWMNRAGYFIFLSKSWDVERQLWANYKLVIKWTWCYLLVIIFLSRLPVDLCLSVVVVGWLPCCIYPGSWKHGGYHLSCWSVPEQIKIFFGNKVCPYHFLDNRALILQNTILYYSLRIHIIGCCEFMRISHRFAKFVWSACRSSAQFSIPFSVGYALCDSMRRVLLQ